MKRTWQRFRKGAAAVSACMLALGILMILWPDISALAVCVILGVFCIAAGIYSAARYFRLGPAGIFFHSDLTFGICGILLGLLLLLHPHGAIAVLPMVIGFFMVIESVLDIQISVELRRLHFNSWGAAMALGVVNTVLAFLLLLNPFRGAAMLMVFIGISLAIGSVQNFYSIHCISKAVEASRDDRVIDVEWRPAE